MGEAATPDKDLLSSFIEEDWYEVLEASSRHSQRDVGKERKRKRYRVFIVYSTYKTFVRTHI